MSLRSPQKKVVLIGFMGSGKSAVGARLAKALGVGFQDLDRWVERSSGSSIPQIFKKRGERVFRRMERAGVRSLTRRSSLVLATGGGAWMDPLNRRRLRRWGTIVWLKVRFSTVWKRVSRNKGQRPLVGNSKDPSSGLLRLFNKRQKTYSLAELSIVTDDRTPSQSCKILLKKLKGLNARR